MKHLFIVSKFKHLNVACNKMLLWQIRKHVSGTQIFNEYDVRNTNESRERRLDHFRNITGAEESSSTSTAKNIDNNVLITIKSHRLDIKKDLIKEFQEKQVSFKLIVQKFIQAYLTSDRWHLKRNFISSVIRINWISSIALTFEVQYPEMRSNLHRSAMAVRCHN